MTRRLVHDERGVALVMALAIMFVLSLTTSALLIVVAVNHRSSLTSAQARKAFSLAQIGLADAEGMVYGAAAARPPTTPATGAQDGGTVDGGTVTYWASVAGDGHTWTMYGKGQYGGQTRTTSAQANVPGPVTVQDTGVWNYLYADSTSGACSTTVQGSTTVAVPMYVHGNLCLYDPFTGSQLGVGGNLIVGSKGSIGSSGSPIDKLAVTGTCNGVTPGTGVCNGRTDPIYASSVSTNLGIAPGLPTLDLNKTYSTDSNPGPAAGHACQTGSGVPTPFFDNDTTLNNSVASINLFPATNYDCINGSNEIKWCATISAVPSCLAANTFYVNGTFYFDGNLALSGNNHIVYGGDGSLYFTGSISTTGNFTLCGVADCGADWDTDPHDPGGAALLLAAACWADSTGSNLVSLAYNGTYCVNYGGTTTMQVATYCATDYFIKGTATNWGPVLANTLTLNGNLSELVPFKIMPPGTPTNTRTSYLPASAPTYWSG
jgi:hypothetical protein